MTSGEVVSTISVPEPETQSGLSVRCSQHNDPGHAPGFLLDLTKAGKSRKRAATSYVGLKLVWPGARAW